MNDEATRAITRVESHTVQAAQAAVPHGQQAPSHPTAEEHPAATHAAVPISRAARTTELSFEPDPQSEKIVVQVVDRDTGTVVRSFSLELPGGETSVDQDPPRGAIVDAKV